MFLLDGSVVLSASDLVRAAECEFAVMRTLDAVLGLREAPEPVVDPVLARAAELGDRHERRHLSAFEARFGDGVVTVERPAMTADALATAADATVAALTAGHPVIYQGALFDGRLVGFADFLVKEDDGYAVYDTKLARRAKVPALLRLAAYADALHRRGIPVSRRTHLLLGDDTTASYPVAELVPVYLQRRARLQTLVDDHHHGGTPTVWEDGRYAACGRCAVCEPEVAAVPGSAVGGGHAVHPAGPAARRRGGHHRRPGRRHRSGAGPVRAQRHHLARPGRRPGAAGADRGASGGGVRPGGVGRAARPGRRGCVLRLRGRSVVGGARQRAVGTGVSVRRGGRVGAGAAVSAAVGAHAQGGTPGVARLPRLPHRAPPRVSAVARLSLRRLREDRVVAAGRAARRGEETVDELLRSGVLVDLYPIVRSALRVGQRGYGLKQLEPLYLGSRGGNVTSGSASIVAYADYCALREAGDTAAAQAVLAEIAAYNEADCLSTLRLRDWLLAQAISAGVRPDGAAVIDDDAVPEPPAPSAHEARLLAFADAGDPERRSAEQQAAALMAAALGYHRRERKPFWWGHYDRLTHPVDEWADARDTPHRRHRHLRSRLAHRDRAAAPPAPTPDPDRGLRARQHRARRADGVSALRGARLGGAAGRRGVHPRLHRRHGPQPEQPYRGRGLP